MAVNTSPKSHIGQKKALLIGIKYEESGEAGLLEGPHEGVAELRKMLIEQYGYADRDIVVMLDNNTVKLSLRPTYSNILGQIDIMVTGAQAGDRFFFAYSGHSGQVPNRHNSEEDGQDETIISSDGKDLIDNILKEHLVDPLPVGSSLVAILDTCHSETLLDLAHYQCNRIYTPRISKGYRKTDFRWNINVRRNAIHNSMEPSAFHELSRARPSRQSQIRKTSRPRLDTTLDSMNFSVTKSKMRTASPSSRLCIRTQIESRSWPVNLEYSPTMSSIIYPMVRCESPTAMWECDGNCRSKYTQATETAAHVVCISACKDEQRAWEGPTGASITMEFIDILKKNPQPSLKDLMVQLTHRTHERCLQIHECTRQIRREPHPESFGEMDNFQDPQLASHIPLNLNELFAL
ncbi:hypothetical protein PILCRDRAFT_818025 [Piloderma croceum F 1598]|uniref:Peptidase C14 caspase domain-containing protein n=1 Tax=Piloderma croceum (strain F 1598) TaxID=765440 RepID=A0A0C3G165_PILCF|nr:hypothetical protein PILCRDRAFT_818025 [Piloderma croceum F 1598]